MNKKLTRILSGTLSLVFVGQVMIYGDGAAQGVLHADTIASAAEAIEEAKNADQLAAEFDEATAGLGNVEYFTSPESDEAGISALSEEDEDTTAFAETWDYTAKSFIHQLDVQTEGSLTITGKVCKGVVSGHAASDDTPIYVKIFDGDWNEVASVEVEDGGSYTVTANNSGEVRHVKFECDGYLPFYLKDFGSGAFQVGTGGSTDTVTLTPGDTTWNEEHENQWSDDVINASDSAYVQSCLGAYRGDSNFNPSMDADGDGTISQADLDAFCAFYESLCS